MAIDLMSAGGAVLDTTTARSEDIKSGKTAYNGDGELVTGTYALPSTTAGAGDILKDKTALDSSGSVITGTITNRGAVSTTVAPGGSYTIAAGYHNGNGKVYGGTSWQFVWGFTCHANRKGYSLGTNSSFGTANGGTWTCKKAGNYRIRAVYSDSIGQSGAGVKKNGSWLFNGMFGDKTQDVSLAVGDTIQIVGGPIYGDPYGPCVATIVIWAI